ncbi:aldo/keto reductase [Cumulibacter soli]|uniref:aldo/keto reductase n=1 Tax=Cumulibacter soli TaxID=2546344 RepID=UPI001067BCC3|nr:aldo/keto reductase [Cumulibacter soli]
MTELPQRELGTGGPRITAVGIGCNNFGRPGTATVSFEGTRAVVDAAINSGVTFFDTAEMYGQPPGTSELLLGEALRKRNRDDVVIATKWGHQAAIASGAQDWGPKGARTYIRNALESSLRRLRTDYVDLYQFHTPDPLTPIAETLGALQELIDEGKVRHIGHTNFTAAEIEESNAAAAADGLTPFVSGQNDYSLLNRDPEQSVLPALAAAGMGFLPYYPLANGLLTGKYTQGKTPQGSRLAALKPEMLASVDWAQLQRFQAICDDADVTMLQATFGWLLARPGLTSVIAGATSPDQVAANAEAGRTDFSADVLAAIEGVFAR